MKKRTQSAVRVYLSIIRARAEEDRAVAFACDAIAEACHLGLKEPPDAELKQLAAPEPTGPSHEWSQADEMRRIIRTAPLASAMELCNLISARTGLNSTDIANLVGVSKSLIARVRMGRKSPFAAAALRQFAGGEA